MIAVAEAKKIIRENIVPLKEMQVPLQDALGMCLSKNIYAALDIPAFPQSSMDGYAFSFSDWQTQRRLKISGEIPAGFDKNIPLPQGHAVRIFTGAAVPQGADTVVMQEKVKVENGMLLIEDEQLSLATNVRPKGSEIKSGEEALPAGTIITPAAIGFLAGIGITEVSVYAKPSVCIIVTGKELQQPGQPLQYGQVYESNSLTLTAALAQVNITDVKRLPADDDLEVLKDVLNSALQQADIILLTGGISVGDYDFVLEAATQCGITKLFHRIKQRPGKPLFFGKKNEQLVFGLPGNPSSVLTCFYEYVIPALQLLGKTNNNLKTKLVPLAVPLKKASGLTHFLKAFYDGKNVLPLNAQESYRLSSFAKANCLIQVNEDSTHLDEGDEVEIHLLPG
jgi:molybdopterin molybdotransferase